MASTLVKEEQQKVLRQPSVENIATKQRSKVSLKEVV